MKLSSAIIAGMQTVRITPANPDCDIFGAALSVVETTRSWSTPESRYEAILGYWPWLEKLISVPERDHYRSLLMEIEYHFDQQVCRGYATLSDLLIYIRSMEPACGECCSFGCICGEVAPLFRELVLQQNREIEPIGAPIHPSDESALPIPRTEPPSPATQPIGEEAADEFEGIPLDSLPPSMRRAVQANRLRIRAHPNEAARQALPAAEVSQPFVMGVTTESRWQSVKRSGLHQLDVWKKAVQVRLRKLTLTQLLLLAIFVVLVAILYLIWQRTSGYPAYFPYAHRSHHYRGVPM